MEELNQIERIKYKLIIAKEADKDLKVFGAESHQYFLGTVISNDQILNFENEYNIELPEAYKTFLLHIGNGGISYQDSAAGPCYGIFPFGKNLNEFIEDPKQFLKEDCKLYPKMSAEFWAELIENIENDTVSDEDFDIESGKIFSGILPVSSQGCTYYSALVLNGEFKGRIVNVDIDRQKPYFVSELNFLDWYERWLDEIIPDDLKENNEKLFSYTLGGTPNYILEIYFSAKNEEIKKECLYAFLKKEKLNSETIDILEGQYKLNSGEIRKILLQVLTRFDYRKAFPYLVEFAKESLLEVFQFIFWYAKDKSSDWLEIIKANVDRIIDEKTFVFCTYLLDETNLDYGDIVVQFTSNENESIRISAYYSLGKLKNKADYLDAFVKGLGDNSNRVVHAVLQALDGVEDHKLLKYYKQIAEKYVVEEDYILVNLNHRLKPFGLTNTTIKAINVGN